MCEGCECVARCKSWKLTTTAAVAAAGVGCGALVGSIGGIFTAGARAICGLLPGLAIGAVVGVVTSSDQMHCKEMEETIFICDQNIKIYEKKENKLKELYNKSLSLKLF